MFDHCNPTQQPLIPGIYSTKLLFNGNYDYRLKIDKEYIENFKDRFETEYLTHLKDLLEKLFSPTVPFTQAENEKKCKNCSYIGICRKK